MENNWLSLNTNLLASHRSIFEESRHLPVKHQLVRRMDSSWYFEEFRLNSIEFEAARDVLLYSWAVQKSVVHLDLSACECSLHTRSVFTNEGFIKVFEPRREIFYKFHLDWARNAEGRLQVIGPDPFETLSVSDSVYNRDLEPLIVNTIRNAENRGEKLRRHFNIMKILNLHQNNSSTLYLFDSIIRILHPDCSDSELIAEFAFTFHFAVWIFHHDNPTLVGYVLKHIRQMGRHLWRTHQEGMVLIENCILAYTAGNVFELLQYGTDLTFDFPYHLIIHFPGRDSLPDDLSRRLRLLFQYTWVYGTFDAKSLQALCYIWRAIPDPYLTDMEIKSTLEKLTPADLQGVLHCYKEVIVEEGESEQVVPRRLQHLCRVVIRNCLIRHDQLPDGIKQLGIPPLIQSYLNLEC